MIHLTKPFKEVLDLYETDYLQAQGRELRANGNRLEHLRRHLGDRQVLTPETIERFILHYRDKKPATRNRYRSLLSHIIKWATERELMEGHISPGLLKVEREHNERDRRLSPEEEDKLYMGMSTNMKDLFVAALDTGLRKGTLLKLQFKHVVDGALVVPATFQKQRKSQRIPLTSRMASIIARRREESAWDTEDAANIAHHHLFVVPDFETQWKNVKKIAGVEGLHWHDLRGEFASRLSEAGVGLETTSRLLGHSSFAMTQRYLRPRTEQYDDAIKLLESKQWR